MGIFDALTTSVGGLQAQSFALQNISGNIANASTVGYKGIDTSFEDLIPDALNPQSQVAGGVKAVAQQTITTQGTVSASGVQPSARCTMRTGSPPRSTQARLANVCSMVGYADESLSGMVSPSFSS